MIEEGSFKARAGLMTLMYLCSTISREDILRILRGACEGDRRPAEECAEKVEAELEEYDVDDYELDETLTDLPTGLSVGPETKVQLSSKGRELIFIAASLERWLAKCPEGPLRLGDVRAGMALQALAYGWSATVIHALAGEPRTLRELDQIVALPSPEILEEHVAALEHVGLVERELDDLGEVRCAATVWLRQAIAPLAAAARLERRDAMDDTAPIDALDVSAGFMLALPLIEPPDELAGACRMEAELDDGAVAGAVAHVGPGEAPWADFGLDLPQVETRASGSIEDWLDTVIEPDAKRVCTEGDRKLAAVLIAGLHRALFGTG